MKTVKYNQGDVLKWSFREKSVTVVLLERWDRKPNQRTAWLVKIYGTNDEPFAAPEDELLPLES